jgi:hypothetical protein
MRFLVLLLLITTVVIGDSRTARKSESARAFKDKVPADELISKHVDAIGPARARAAAGARLAAGTTRVTFRSRGVAQADGSAVLASDGPRSMVTMKFESSQYPYEKIGFDGNKVTAFQLHPGEYSRLGNFIRSTPEVFKEGLLGGTLSSAWPFLGFPDRKFRLEVGGLKKVNNRPAYEVKYITRGGSDLSIVLYFDAETFQHVRSVYRKVLPAQMGRAAANGSTAGDHVGESSAQQSSTIYEMTEEFSDFKLEGELTLPHTYKLKFEQVGASSQTSEWVMTLVMFAFHQQIKSADFDVSTE